MVGLVKLSVAVAAAVLFLVEPASAHHPLGGMPMTTFGHGLLSGVGHPILGFDHLFFVVAVGVAALYTGRAFTAPLSFVAAMLAGVGLVVSGITLPLVEPVIAISLVVLGGLVMTGRALALPIACALFAGLGLFHGWAFGETLAGQEGGAPMVVTVGYLIGLAGTQWAIAVGAGQVVAQIWKASSAESVPARLTGAVVAGVGAFLTLEVMEGVAFSALGIG